MSFTHRIDNKRECMRSTKYIDLLLNEDYPTVIEKTENGNTSL